jgi:hypothetical protein
LSRFRAGNRAVVCRIKCRERGSTISAGAVGRPHKGDAVMMEERLPCLPGLLYRAVPPRSADDGRVPRFLDRSGRDGRPAFGHSDLNMSATKNQPARIIISTTIRSCCAWLATT